MGDEITKRSIDCVYFLASPLTCNKGAECEYRHSDTARMNPRDCWYWLSGTCTSAACPFRHPPLDVHNEVSTEVPASVTVTKTTVPCYYYYNGFCNKGDTCPFLHEWRDTFAWNPKERNTVTDEGVPHVSSKTFGKSDAVATHEEHPTLSEKAVIIGDDSQAQHRQPTQPRQLAQSREPAQPRQPVQQRQPAQQSQLTYQACIKNVDDENANVQAYVPEYQPTADVDGVSLEPSDDSPKSESEPNLSSDESSEEELIDGNVMGDEWWESSPGFDVLVDEQTHGMAYEHDLEYVQSHDGCDADRDPLYVRRAFETDYDERMIYQSGLYQPSEHFDNELGAHYGSISPRLTHNREVRHIESLKRKFGDSVDLRDHLRRKRMHDYYYLDSHDLRHDLLHKRYDRSERFARHRPNQHLYGRLASRMENNGVWLDRRKTSTLQGRLGNSFKKYSRKNRSNSSAQAQSRSALKRERYAPGFTRVEKNSSFTKNEESKRQGYCSNNGSVDFEGPKPLSEILKEKKKTVFCEDRSMTGCC